MQSMRTTAKDKCAFPVNYFWKNNLQNLQWTLLEGNNFDRTTVYKFSLTMRRIKSGYSIRNLTFAYTM